MHKTKLSAVLALAALVSAPIEAQIKKVTLVVNYGQGAILHPGAVQPFINMMNALKTEKAFELTITQQTDPTASKQAALNNLKSQDVVLFANIGENSFPAAADRLLIEKFIMEGGKAIGYHATIDHHKYWAWWETLHNGSGFQGHGNGAFTLNLDPEISKIPSLQKMWTQNNLGDPNISNTEIYTLNVYPRGKEGVTMMQVVAPPNNAIAKHDFTWHRTIGQGKYIFTCLGHGPNDFIGDWLKKATWAWMEYLNGKYDVPTALRPGQRPPFGIKHEAGMVTVHSRQGFSAEIRDVKGAVVLARRGHDQASLSLAGFQPGLYFVKVRGAEGMKSLRVLVR